MKQLELSDGWGYALALTVVAIATGINSLLERYLNPPTGMIYLLGVALVAGRCSLRPAFAASLMGVVAYNLFFQHSGEAIQVSENRYVFTSLVMISVGVVISTLAIQLRERTKASSQILIEAQLEKERGNLLSSVSHDLRTPLASIEGSAGALLGQPGLSEQSRQLATTIQEECVRLGKQVRNLLDMTRVQGQISLNVDWYSLDELVANAILRTESLFTERVALVLEPDTPLVRVDGVLIEQVFVNLLENAAKYAGRNLPLEITIAPAQAAVRVSVVDHGPGIPPSDQERVFERFTGTRGKGYGLGLAICRAAVRAHGGRIWIEETTGGGATFVIELPIEGEDAHE